MAVTFVNITHRHKAAAAWVAAVAIVGLAAAFGLWEPLEVYERSHVAKTTHQAMESLERDLESDMQARLLAQVRLAELWGTHVLSSENEWELSSRLFLDHHAGYLTLEWVDSDYRVLCVAGRHGETEPAVAAPDTEKTLRSLRLETPVSQPGTAIITSRFSLADGRPAVRVVVPVVRQNQIAGYLVAVVDVRDALDSMTSDHKDLGYSVALTDGRTEIYRMPGSLPNHETELAAQGTLQLPGASWSLRVWPKPELLSVMRSSLPKLAMVLGGLLGGVLVLAIHFARAARQTSRELQCAHDKLEERVKARTIELEEAGKALQAEVADRTRAEDSYRDLSGRLLRLQDEERRRFARELHDSTAQVLGALAINVDRSLHLARAGEVTRLADVLRDSGKIVEEVTQEIRTVSHLLHPPMLDDLGLEYVLPWYADGFGRRSGIAVTLDIQPDLGRLPSEIELTLFRIVQEALANVHRHSGSPSVSIALSRTADAATLVVGDRGRGLPRAILEAVMGEASAPIGVGMAGMRGRVNQLSGVLDIASNRQGTTIRAVLPLAAGTTSGQTDDRELPTTVLAPHDLAAAPSCRVA
jgi:signal transduction histidine kinase